MENIEDLFEELNSDMRCFDAEVSRNLSQLNLIVDFLNKNNDLVKQSQLLTNLNALYFYYKDVLVEKGDPDQLRFIQYVIIKRLNHLNDCFNLNKKLLINETDINTPICILKDYDVFDRIDPQSGSLHGKFELKLLINSVNFNLFDNSANSGTDEYVCYLYQFDKLARKRMRNFKKLHKQVILQQNEILKSKTKRQFINSKRSSSADPNKIKSKFKTNKLANEYLYSSTSTSSSSSSSSTSSLSSAASNSTKTKKPFFINSKFKLNENCLQINSFSFNKNSRFNPKSINLKSNCDKLIVILYKIIMLNNDESESAYLKIPIKYECFYIGSNNELTMSISLRTTVPDPKETNLQDNNDIQAKSVFRRMFKKSKSSTRGSGRNGSVINDKQKIRNELITFKNEFNHFINNNMEYSTELNSESFLNMKCISTALLSEYLDNNQLINIDKFTKCIECMRPVLNENGIKLNSQTESNECLQTISIFLNSIDLKLSHKKTETLSHRSKYDEFISANRQGRNTPTLPNKITDPVTNCYYFIQIKLDNPCKYLKISNSGISSDTYRSTLFKSHQNINDICQVEISKGYNLSHFQLKFELYQIISINTVKLVASSYLVLYDRKAKISRLILNLVESSNISEITLRLKLVYISKYYPSKRISIDLYEFTFDNSSKEKELYSMIEAYLSAASFTDFILIGKFIEILSTVSQLNHSKADLADRRLFRRNLLSKIYEAFIRILNEFDKTNNIGFFKNVINYLNIQPRQVIQVLLSILKDLIETQIDSEILELTLQSFHLIIDIVSDLAQLSNSKFELKYELNDLIVKLSKNLTLKHKLRLYPKLNLKFLNTLVVDLFNGYELASLISSKLFMLSCSTIQDQTSFNSLIIEIINQKLFELKIFVNNYQFRDRIVEFVIGTFLTGTFTVYNNEQLSIVKNLLLFRNKLSKQNLDALTRSSLKPVIYSLIESFKSGTNLVNFNVHIEQAFVCLIELIDIILINNTNKTQMSLIYFEKLLNENDLGHLFEILIYYFRINKTSQNRHKLWTQINLIIFKFANYIQKYLLRHLINKQQIEDLNGTSESLIKSYLDMLFIYINQPTLSFSLNINMKLNMLNCLISFWKSLNIKLKRSVLLNEFIIRKTCKCIVNNFYFKVISSQNVSISPFINGKTQNENLNSFYNILIKLLHDIFLVNQYDFDQFREFIYLNIIQILIRIEKSRKCLDANNVDLESGEKKKKEEILEDEEDDDEDASLVRSNLFLADWYYNLNAIDTCKSYSDVIFNIISENFGSSFSNDSNRQSLLLMIQMCVDYNLLKERHESGADLKISMLERLIFIYDMIKITSRINVTLFPHSKESLGDSKRKILMYLLEDLYHLNKSEKNFLQMSFIRKEQADLLEWNFNKKSESDLKEILYLKSLKKFAINSLHEKFLFSEPEYYARPIETFSPQGIFDENNKLMNSPKNFINSIQFEICKQLCGYYEKLDENYSKFKRILNAESKFAQLASNSIMKSSLIQSSELLKTNQHGHSYFRIGFFGSNLKFQSIRNKYFLYKHHSYEMLSNIQHLIMNKLIYSKWNNDLNEFHNNNNNKIVNNVTILHHNQEPDSSTKENPNKCFIQICAVNKLEKSKLFELIDEMNEDDKSGIEMKNYLNKHDKTSYFYYFDRPFYLQNNDKNKELKNSMQAAASAIDSEDSVEEEFQRVIEHESVENLWLERSILITDEDSMKFENLTQFEEIKIIFKILLNPIRNAISDINEKTKELKHFVVQFTANQSNNANSNNMNLIHSLQPLTMRLLGCLDARVNGGLIKYVKELINENSMNSKLGKKKKVLLHQLYISIRDQLNVLESGLSIHDRILKDVEIRYKDLNSKVHDMNDLDMKHQKNFEHLKHMNELNKHLIDCLKMIENELNERWSKFI